MTDLQSVITNPAVQAGLGAIRPDLGIALQVVTSLLNGWHEQSQINAAITTIDARAAEHVKQLTTQTLSSIERSEIEIRLHELLTILMKLGGL